MIETFAKGTRVTHRDYGWHGTVGDEDKARIWVNRDDSGKGQWYDKLMFIRKDRTDATQAVDAGVGVDDTP